MSTRVALALYVAAWLVFAVLFVAATSYAGLSLWLSAALAYLLFLSVNGTLAYRHRRRQLALQENSTPPYLRYLLVGEGISREVALPRPIRWLLALVVGAGGVSFVAVAVIFAISLPSHHVQSRAAAAALLFLLALMGLAFTYVGVRLALVKDNERLFSRPRFLMWRRRSGA